MSTSPDATWTPLDAAAAALGISPDATRKRVERGTLTGEKRHGRLWVLLDNRDATGRQSSGQPDATGRQPDEPADAAGTPPIGQDGASGRQTDAKRTPPDAMSDTTREYIDHLKATNEFLRAQLEEATRQAEANELARQEERKRFDVIHRTALDRLEELNDGLKDLRADPAEDDAADPNDDEADPAENGPVDRSGGPGRAQDDEWTQNPEHQPSVFATLLQRVFRRN